MSLLGPGVVALATGCGRDLAKGAQGPAGVPVKIEVAASRERRRQQRSTSRRSSRASSAVIMPQVEGQITEIFVHAGRARRRRGRR